MAPERFFLELSHPSELLRDAPHVVIVGGGFAGLRAAHVLAGKTVRVTLIDRRNFYLFQPLLYQVASGLVSQADVASPLRQMVGQAPNLQILLGEVDDLDVEANEVIFNDRRYRYDHLIIAAGAGSSYFGHDDWRAFATPMKTLEDAAAIRRQVLSALEEAEQTPDPARRQLLQSVVVIGGGVLEGLHRRCEGPPLVVTEVAAAGTGRQDQMVVAVAAVVEDHLPGLGVEVVDLAEQDLHIGGLAHHLAQGGGHVGLRHQSGGHLIEQGLKQVEIAPVDQGDPHRFPGQRMGCLETGKASAHDHHMGLLAQGEIRWGEFKEEALRCHGHWPVARTLCRFGGFGLLLSLDAANTGLIGSLIMSIASLEAFCARIAADADLRGQVHAAAGVDDIVAIAAAHGHDVDKTVLLREHARALSSASDQALAGINSWGDALMHCFGAEEAETEV